MSMNVFNGLFASQKILLFNTYLLEMGSEVMRESRELWMLLTIGFLLLIFAFIRAAFPGVVFTIFGAYYDNTLLSQFSKEDRPFVEWPYLLLYLLLGFGMGMFALLCKQAGFIQWDALADWQFFLLISLCIIVLFFLKILVIRIIGSIFTIRHVFRNYILVLYLIYYNVGIGLLGVASIMILLPFAHAKWLVPTVFTLLGMMFLFRLVKTGVDALRNYRFPIFYFIIYLCTLELAPILILFKIVSR